MYYKRKKEKIIYESYFKWQKISPLSTVSVEKYHIKSIVCVKSPGSALIYQRPNSFADCSFTTYLCWLIVGLESDIPSSLLLFVVRMVDRNQTVLSM